MATRMLQRRGTAAEWAADNPVLGDGEIGFERDTYLIKMGDGVTAWNDLDTVTNRYLRKAGGAMTGALTLIAPTLEEHAARVAEVTAAESAIRTDMDAADTTLGGDISAVDGSLTAHEGTTDPHSATALATPSRIALRDANGRSKFADPSDPADVSTKGYADGLNALAIPKSLIDAAGDLLIGSADNTVARLPKDVDGKILGIASGSVGWLDPLGGGATLITDYTVPSDVATVTFSSLPSNFRDLWLFTYDLKSNSNNLTKNNIVLTMNGDSGTNYFWGGTFSGNPTTGQSQPYIYFFDGLVTSYYADSQSMFSMRLRDYATARSARAFEVEVFSKQGTSPNWIHYHGVWNSSVAVSSMEFAISGSQLFAAGSRFIIYGVG